MPSYLWVEEVFPTRVVPAAAILVPREPLGLGGRRSLQAGRQRPRGPRRRPRGVVAVVVARRVRDRCGEGALHHGLVELPLCISLISLSLYHRLSSAEFHHFCLRWTLRSIPELVELMAITQRQARAPHASPRRREFVSLGVFET